MYSSRQIMKLSDSQMTELFEKHRTKLINAFKKKNGSGNYGFRLVLTEDSKFRLEFGGAGKVRPVTVEACV